MVSHKSFDLLGYWFDSLVRYWPARYLTRLGHSRIEIDVYISGVDSLPVAWYESINSYGSHVCIKPFTLKKIRVEAHALARHGWRCIKDS